MKRKLSIALALLTSPEVLILDEPTAALDPETRRTIWSLIKDLRGKASVLLSTHDMEEADVLGDRIIVMYQGSVICWGSPSFLKDACDVGYKLRFQKQQKVFKSKAVLAVVKKSVPKATIEEEKENEAIIALNTMERKNFPALFRVLESGSKRLGIQSTGVTVATMQDAYIKIYKDWVGGQNNEPIGGKGAAETKINMVPLVPRTLQRFRALMEKRLLFLWRTPFLFVTGWILPVFLAYTGLNIVNLTHFQAAPKQSYINLSTIFSEATTEPPLRTFIHEDATENTLRYKYLLEKENIPYDVFTDILGTLRAKHDKNYFEYLYVYAFGSAFNKTVWLYWGLLVPMSIGLIISTFVVLPSMEICNESRELQLMTGMSGYLYLGTNFLFDLLFYVVPVAVIYLGFALSYHLSANTQVSTAPIVARPTQLILGLFAIGGPGIFIAYLFTIVFEDGDNLRLPFLLFPPFQLPAASVRAINFENELAACHYMRTNKDTNSMFEDFCDESSWISAIIKFCCDVVRNKTKQPWHDFSLLSTSRDGIVWDLVLMLVYGILILLYLLYRLSESRSRNALPEGRAAIPEDEDVAAEWTAVEKICQDWMRDFGNNNLVARRLHKSYGTLQAVQELSLALKPAECFGLLGVNGAGKTTTFRMLTALTPMTYGEGFMRDVQLSEEPRKWQSRIGYCPQGNALLEKLSAYECLYLFGRLRGVPEESLHDVVWQMIVVTGLQELSDKRCDYYSGGNKRKLSIAIALVGLPNIIFLDEPYAGVDVVARTRIYQRLNDIKARTKCTMVLTSHSMEECEVSCDRICIMVKGMMVCLGTLQHLKDKFGTGCSIQFLLRDNTTVTPDNVIKAVAKAFPGMTVTNTTQELIEIRTSKKLPWSVLFSKLQSLDKEIGFEHVLASDITLEQLFILFAEKGEKEDQQAPINS
ncbi:hypothetical protein MTO96_038379 [Rhipicephalus appendiculatus]